MDSSSGILHGQNNKLSKDRYRFNVKVSDGRVLCTALVTVLVREAMDSGLLFSQTSYFSSVLENSVNITTVNIVNAVGNRLNEPLKYTLLNAGTRLQFVPHQESFKPQESLSIENNRSCMSWWLRLVENTTSCELLE